MTWDVRLMAAAFAGILGACAGAPSGTGGTGGSGSGSGGSGGSGVGSGTGGATTGTGGTHAGTGGGAVIISSGGPGGSTSVGATGGAPGTGGGGVATGGTGVTVGTGGTTVGGGGRGGSSATGGAAGAPPSTGTGGTANFEKAAGKIQNTTQAASTTNLQKSQWKQGLISPTLLGGTHLNQPAVFNGYLMVAGNEDFFFYDVSDATSPKQLSKMSTPGRRAGGEAESHTISFARDGSTFYMVTLSGVGIDTWDVTSVTAPKHLGQLKISGVNYGDYTEAVWGVSWQGQYIYVGATNNGVKVVDATDPANLKLAGEVPTSSTGGVSAGPVDAIGNVLVVMTPKESSGVATLDISNPTAPTRLASLTTSTKSYITQFHRHYAVMLGPVRVWDVLTNPKSIGSGSSPIATFNNEYAEYSVFSDDYLFIGHARQEINATPGCSKITFSDPKSMKVVNRIYGRLDTTYNDDQFVLPMGNLVVLTDDQSPYRGWVIAVHQTAPDTTPPVVDTVIPNNNATGVSVKSRVGVTFSDNIDLATVNQASFIVRPVGGQALPGRYGVRMGVVNFDPTDDLQPGTTYEVVLPKGGIADYVGNTLATEWKSTFATN
ncbi:MAG TPA: Ig-like domain-containing protein [Polyangia bacterium]|nr:Ig-like domain-containing protein [Polyangia bacterium]